MDGKTGIVEVAVEKGSTITLPEPTRDGYTFDYWKGSKYYAGDEFVADEDHDFVAQWVVADNTDPDEPDAAGPAAGTDDNNNSGKSGKSVRTGDDSNLSFWLAMMIASALGFLVLRKKTDR